MWHKRNECRQNPFCCCAESVVALDANAVGDGFKQICMDRPKKKDKDRREGKGRRLCLGGRMYPRPCHASCFASQHFNYWHQDDLKEKDEFILIFKIVLNKNG